MIVTAPEPTTKVATCPSAFSQDLDRTLTGRCSQVLELPYCGISDMHAPFLAAAISVLTALTAIDVRWNALGARGVAALAPGLLPLRGLQQLNLSMQRGVECKRPRDMYSDDDEMDWDDDEDDDEDEDEDEGDGAWGGPMDPDGGIIIPEWGPEDQEDEDDEGDFTDAEEGGAVELVHEDDGEGSAQGEAGVVPSGGSDEEAFHELAQSSQELQVLLGEETTAAGGGDVQGDSDEFEPAATAQVDLMVRGRSVSPSQSPERAEQHGTSGAASSGAAPPAVASSWGASTSHAAMATGTQRDSSSTSASGDVGTPAGDANSGSGAETEPEGVTGDADTHELQDTGGDEDEEQYDDAHDGEQGEQPGAELDAALDGHVAAVHEGEAVALDALQVQLVGMSLAQSPEFAGVVLEDSGVWFRSEEVVTALWEAVLAHPLTLGVRL